MDVSDKALDKVEERAKKEGPSNIIRIDTTGDQKIPLKDRNIDLVLLIDVLKDINGKKSLFDEIYRVLRPSGGFTVFLMHMQIEDVEKLANCAGFKMDARKF